MYNFKVRILLTSFYRISHTNLNKATIKDNIIFFLALKAYFNKNSNINISIDSPLYRSNKFKVLRAPYKNKNAWTPYAFKILILPINIEGSINNSSISYLGSLENFKFVKNLVESFGSPKTYGSVYKSSIIFNFNSILKLKEWAK